MKRRILPLILLIAAGAASLAGLGSGAGAAPRLFSAQGDSAAALSTDPAEDIEETAKECPGAFNGFRHAVSWYNGKNRVLIEAGKVCGSRIGIMKLHEVTVTIQSGRKTVTRFSAPDAVFSRKSNQLLVTSASFEVKGCLTPGPILTLDLLTGELRSSGLRVFLNSPEAPSCGYTVAAVERKRT